ncbi:MAG TPA: hypothetical protein VKS79_11365, partial [Gemmataceae bacterium]|nr:hypothetical protein [Gemmataceae bacterium]
IHPAVIIEIENGDPRAHHLRHEELFRRHRADVVDEIDTPFLSDVGEPLGGMGLIGLGVRRGSVTLPTS